MASSNFYNNFLLLCFNDSKFTNISNHVKKHIPQAHFDMLLLNNVSQENTKFSFSNFSNYSVIAVDTRGGGYSSVQATHVGDLLGQCSDAGRGVILGMSSHYTSSSQSVDGKIMEYHPLEYVTDVNSAPGELGQYDAHHPIMQHVHTLKTNSGSCYFKGNAKSNAQAIAYRKDKCIWIAEATNPISKAKIIGFNMNLFSLETDSEGWIGDGMFYLHCDNLIRWHFTCQHIQLFAPQQQALV